MTRVNPAMEHGLPFPPHYGSELLVLSRGRGVWLRDAAGKRYIDFAGGIAVNALGYGRADLAKTAYRQMRKLTHVSNLFTTEPALALARAMLAFGPWRFTRSSSATAARKPTRPPSSTRASIPSGRRVPAMKRSCASPARSTAALSDRFPAPRRPSTRTLTSRCSRELSLRPTTTCRRSRAPSPVSLRA